MNSIQLLPADKLDQAQIATARWLPARGMTPAPGVSWVMVATLTAVLTGVSGYQSIHRYRDLRSGWSWDLALLQPVVLGVVLRGRHADRPTRLGVRPGRPVDLEDELPGSDPAGDRAALPAVSRSGHLLLIQNVMFWWVDPRGLYARAVGDAIRSAWRCQRLHSCP